uniref:E3 UFM1-protein ligase 1 homolog n=1 Tax=Strongyloides venezuelensis TaxID=75913 RepID=A0A0K0G1J4_STRVS
MPESHSQYLTSIVDYLKKLDDFNTYGVKDEVKEKMIIEVREYVKDTFNRFSSNLIQSTQQTFSSLQRFKNREDENTSNVSGSSSDEAKMLKQLENNMATWADIQKLANELQLRELSLIDIIFSNDGKEYVTKKRLQSEIMNECVGRKERVSMDDLVMPLNVDFEYIVEGSTIESEMETSIAVKVTIRPMFRYMSKSKIETYARINSKTPVKNLFKAIVSNLDCGHLDDDYLKLFEKCSNFGSDVNAEIGAVASATSGEFQVEIHIPPKNYDYMMQQEGVDKEYQELQAFVQENAVNENLSRDLSVPAEKSRIPSRANTIRYRRIEVAKLENWYKELNGKRPSRRLLRKYAKTLNNMSKRRGTKKITFRKLSYWFARKQIRGRD